MDHPQISELIASEGIPIFTLIYFSGNRAKVMHVGPTSDLLPTLRAALASDSLLLAAVSDVVDEKLATPTSALMLKSGTPTID